MKSFYQAPVVSSTFPSSRKPQHVFFSRSSYCHCSLQNQLVASKVAFMYNKKYKRQMIALSSLHGMPDEKFPESGWDICKDSSSESLYTEDAEQKMLAQDKSKWNVGADHMDARFIESIVFDKTFYNYGILDIKTSVVNIMKQQGLISDWDGDEIVRVLDKIEQDIVLGKFEWRDGQNVHTNIMEALVNMVGERAKEHTITNQSDRCTFVLKTWCKDCIEHITIRIKRLQVALISLAIRNEGLVLPGTRKTEGNTSIDSIILPTVEALGHVANDLLLHDSQITTSSVGCEAYFERNQIRSIVDIINYDVPEHLMLMVEKFVSWRNLPFFIPSDEVVTYDTFLEKFRPNEMTDNGSSALLDCLNITSFRSKDHCDIEDARFYIFSSVKNVMEMLDLCVNFAEGISFNQEKVQIMRSNSDAISFAHFLTSKGLGLETSYSLVRLCLKKQCQPWEITPEELHRIGPTSDSLEEIQQARSLLLEKHIIFDSSIKMLIWSEKLQIDPDDIC